MGFLAVFVYVAKCCARFCSNRWQRRGHDVTPGVHIQNQRVYQHEVQPLLKRSYMPVFDGSDFLFHAVSDKLNAGDIARLRSCCRDTSEKVGHDAHVVFLVNERRDRLPGLAKMETIGEIHITSLRDLSIAETPSMEAVLCIFGFASTEPQFDEETTDTMAKFAELLREYSQVQLQIVGHGQPGAPEPLASDLAQERADNVASEFARRHGVPNGRMVLSHCSNRKPRFREPEKNRRVELFVVSNMARESPETSLHRCLRSALLGRLGFASHTVQI